jgi:hypothetical protein
LVILELAAFEAYWPMMNEKKDWASWLRGLTEFTPSLDKELIIKSLEDACQQLGLPKDKWSLFRSELQSVNRSFSGDWKRVAIVAGVTTAAAGAGALTAGMALPLIGGFVGHAWMGLAGAAAVKAGLAALGGGSIAAGGLGIAGGTAVVVGGGALLGGIGGYSIAAVMNPATVLIQAVKIEVFLKCIVAECENAKPIINDVLSQLEASITSMSDELKKARLDPKIEKNSIADRERMIEILGTCSKRCCAWAKEKGFLYDGGSVVEGTAEADWATKNGIKPTGSSAVEGLQKIGNSAEQFLLYTAGGIGSGILETGKRLGHLVNAAGAAVWGIADVGRTAEESTLEAHETTKEGLKKATETIVNAAGAAVHGVADAGSVGESTAPWTKKAADTLAVETTQRSLSGIRKTTKKIGSIFSRKNS